VLHCFWRQYFNVFKSSSLTKETLLTPYDSLSDKTLADKYAEVNGLRDAWKENKKIGKDVYFPSVSKTPLLDYKIVY
jgi:hypothetical protein